jgi:dTDP-4-amino-4,6-dideoxy-D-galactose acyltransferase
VRGNRLTRETLARIERWAARESVECLYFLADAADPETAPLAEEAGFRLVDVRMTLDRRLRSGGGGAGGGRASGGGAGASAAGAAPAEAVAVRQAAPAVALRRAAPADVPELRRIAAASHHDSRFYHDPHFDRGRCGELYSIWIENCCGDPDGAVLVAAAARPAAGAGAICGYVTAGLPPDGQGRIGLFAVAATAQGQGIGGRLIAAALEWLEDRGAATVSVVTQGRNVRAQRIYQQFGMRTRSLELWYHRWW